MIGRIRAAGAEPIFVILPKVLENDLGEINVLRSYVTGCDVIDFASLPDNEFFYIPERWIDPYHLGSEAAEELTKKLASSLSH